MTEYPTMVVDIAAPVYVQAHHEPHQCFNVRDGEWIPNPACPGDRNRRLLEAGAAMAEQVMLHRAKIAGAGDEMEPLLSAAGDFLAIEAEGRQEE